MKNIKICKTKMTLGSFVFIFAFTSIDGFANKRPTIFEFCLLIAIARGVSFKYAHKFHLNSRIF